MVPPVLTCQALLTYSTSYRLPRLAFFCFAKLMVTPGALEVIEAQLDWMDVPRCSYYGTGFLNGHVLPKPTGRKVGVFSQQLLQQEVFVVQKGKSKLSSLSGRRHRCGALLHRQQ